MPQESSPSSLAHLQEKALRDQWQTLSDVEILTLLLAPDSSEIAHYLMTRFQSLPELARASLENLMQIPELGKARAIRLKAALSLAQRLSILRASERPAIQRPADVIDLVQDRFVGVTQEHLVVVLLDAHNRVMEIETVYIGSLNTTVVRVAEIFRDAILRNCAGIILVHNHPSGKAYPSSEDVQLTEDLVAAGKLLDIVVLDHLIIGDGEWMSLRERGLGF